MLHNILLFLAYLAKGILLLAIVGIVILSIIRHNTVKMTRYDMNATIVFTGVVVVLYALGGVFNHLSFGLFILCIIHALDLKATFKNEGIIAFTVHKWYHTFFGMMIYFVALYMANFWSPILNFR